jgi:hypothetical protein
VSSHAQIRTPFSLLRFRVMESARRWPWTIHGWGGGSGRGMGIGIG